MAFFPLKEIHEQAKNRKTKVIRELIETTFNKSHSAFYNWANYNTYAKLTEQNILKMNLIRNAILITQTQMGKRINKLLTLGGKLNHGNLIARTIERLRHGIMK